MTPGAPLPAPTQLSPRVPSPPRSPFSLFAFRFSLSLLLLLPACSRPPEPGTPILHPRVFGGLGDTPGRYGYPRCIETDGSSLWVIDRTARVQRIDPKTGLCTGYFHTPEAALGKPCGLDIAPGFDEHGAWADTLLYIADTHYHRVLIYHPPALAPGATDQRKRELTPPLVATFGTYGREPGQFIYPTDVAVLLAADGKHVERVYVAEYGGNDRVSVFAPGAEPQSFKFLFAFGSFGTSADPANIQFSRPQSLAFDHTKSPAELVITDSCNHRVGIFTLEGKLLRWLGGPDAKSAADIPEQPSTVDIPPLAPSDLTPRIASAGKPAKFLYPHGLRLLPDGTAIISEFGAGRVQQIDLETGTCLASWGRPGRGDGELAFPWALTSLDSTIYVLDSGNNRVQAFPTPSPKH